MFSLNCNRTETVKVSKASIVAFLRLTPGLESVALKDDGEIWGTHQIFGNTCLIGMYNPPGYNLSVGLANGFEIKITGDAVGMYEAIAEPTVVAKTIIDRLGKVSTKDQIAAVVGRVPAALSILDRILIAGAIQEQLDIFAKVEAKAALAARPDVENPPMVDGMFGFMPTAPAQSLNRSPDFDEIKTYICRRE